MTVWVGPIYICEMKLNKSIFFVCPLLPFVAINIEKIEKHHFYFICSHTRKENMALRNGMSGHWASCTLYLCNNIKKCVCTPLSGFGSLVCCVYWLRGEVHKTEFSHVNIFFFHFVHDTWKGEKAYRNKMHVCLQAGKKPIAIRHQLNITRRKQKCLLTDNSSSRAFHIELTGFVIIGWWLLVLPDCHWLCRFFILFT